jgi:hypothetical protein
MEKKEESGMKKEERGQKRRKGKQRGKINAK